MDEEELPEEGISENAPPAPPLCRSSEITRRNALFVDAFSLARISWAAAADPMPSAVLRERRSAQGRSDTMTGRWLGFDEARSMPTVPCKKAEILLYVCPSLRFCFI
jgi:hypothetical protein